MKIKYEQTSIEITADAFSNITNEIRYEISANLTDAEKLQELFPEKKFTFIDEKLKFAELLSVPNMPILFENVKIEASDVDLSVKNATEKWLINIIYNLNLLDLDTNKFKIV